jgi:rare lipoprotein A (peptidoglycan hydrolase)
LRRLFIALLAPLLVLAAWIPQVSAEPLADYDTDAGHFFTQGNGLPSGTSQAGFELSNADSIPFWDAYQKMGGSKQLGYPVSVRFQWQGTTNQAVQQGVLQWDPAGKRVAMMNLMDLFAASGKDDWLRGTYHVPSILDQSSENGLPFPQIMARRVDLLQSNAKIASLYRSASDPLSLYGLPTSSATDMDVAVVMRTQRNVLYHWKTTTSLGNAGTTTSGSPGEMLRSSGLVGSDVFQPQNATAPTRNQVSSRSGERTYLGTGNVAFGKATWYGPGFHGGITRYGEIYNMYDPTTCAANNYPYNTMLRVTATSSGNSIVVRVNNTGGFRYPLLVDLSYAAFGKLAHHDAGVISVTVEVVK